MAKKLTDIEFGVKCRSVEFYRYFNLNITPTIKKFLDVLLLKTNVFIFSGIIRDFFTKPSTDLFRDIDLIIEHDLQIESVFENLSYRKNSFGGYKINLDGFTIDLWVIRKTWALVNGQLTFEFNYLDTLPKTTFFNFSSILYSINEEEFIVGTDFLRFLRDKKIEIVFNKNPYPELCIVNSFYYQDKLKLAFGKKLKKYISENYRYNIEKFEAIQLKHFGKIVYPLDILLKRISKLE